jgi:Electron transfer DM13
MKLLKFLPISILALFSIMGCEKSSTDTNSNTGGNSSSTFDITKATLIKQGSFSGNMSYVVTGTAGLYDFEGKKYIYLQNFSTSAGPDLKLYVATTTSATQFVSLGTLKSNSGTQSYLITNPPDFNTYNKVLIWCQQFSVLFGASTIQ